MIYLVSDMLMLILVISKLVFVFKIQISEFWWESGDCG